MDKNSLLLSFYSGREINLPVFEEYFSTYTPDKTEYKFQIIGEWENVLYELHAYIENSIVISVGVSKIEDINMGHGRPHSIEKNLTSSEWKYAYQVFDECFLDQFDGEVNDVIINALQKKVSFSGYTITKELKNDVVFVTMDGKAVKLPKKRISQAVHYSHKHLDILFNPDVAEEFNACLGKSSYEPLFAVLSVVNPEEYPNYESLLAEYRFSELIKAIEAGNIEECRKYEDIVTNPEAGLVTIGEAVSKGKNYDIADWFFNIVPEGSCDLNSALYTAIEAKDENIVSHILSKKLFNASVDSSSWSSPMAAALDNPKFVPLLLETEFALSSDKYLLKISLDELKKDLQYDISFGEPVIDRIISNKRYDILDVIENAVPKYCKKEALLSAYITAKDFDRFKKGVEQGWFSETKDFFGESLFEKTYNAGEQWADILVRNGFDINQNNGQMLYKACRDLKVDYAIYLLKNGADPYLREEHSSTAFELAAGFHGYLDGKQQKEQEKLCKYLLDMGVDPIMESKRTPSIFTYLMNLSTEFKLYLVDWIGTHNRINNFECQNDRKISGHGLLYSVLDPYSDKKYDSQVLKKMLGYGAKVDVAEYSKDKLFIQACAVCGVEDLKLFIESGANINELDNAGCTNGLFEAVLHNQPKEVIEFLISVGFDVNSMKKESHVPAYYGYSGGERVIPAKTVLDVAIENKNQELIEVLKSHGAKTAEELGK